MLISKITSAGIYTHAQRFCQTINGLWVCLFVSGMKQNNIYFPDGKLLKSCTTQNDAKLAILADNFTLDFEFDSNRRNWIIIIENDSILYDKLNHRLKLNHNNTWFDIPFIIDLEPNETAETELIFREIESNYSSGLPANILAAELILAKIIARFVANTTTRNDPVELLRHKLDQDEQWEANISILSTQSGYSRDHLRLLFFERYKIYPHEYRNQRRIKKIMQLITYSNLSFKEIAAEVGMKNVTHLYKLMKKYYPQYTPGELCKKYRIG